jgi:hypothetical protein
MEQEYKSLTSLRDKYLPKEGDAHTREKAVKAAERRLSKEVMDLNEQIKNEEKAAATKPDKTDSPALQQLRLEKQARQAMLEALDPTPDLFIKNALIEKGFGREITISTKNGKEQRQVLDWKKLAGAEGSVDKMKAHIAQALQDKGFSEEQILRIQDKFDGEYTDLRATVIEHALNELGKRNTETVTAAQRSAARKLAELYNYGLFEQDPSAYGHLMAQAIGTTTISPERFQQVAHLGKALQALYGFEVKGKKLSDLELKSAVQDIEEQMRTILHEEAQQHGSTALKLADWTRTIMDASQRMMLLTLKQTIDNPLSGQEQLLMSSIGYDGGIPKAFTKQQRAMAASVYKDMVLSGGAGFGDVNTTFVNKGSLEMHLNKMSDSQLFHAVTSTIIGKSTLDAADSFFKSKLTEKKFAYNLIKILTTDRLIDGKIVPAMDKQAAMQYVAEKLTGQSFQEAQVTARHLIDKVNSESGTKILRDTPAFIDRLANDIVKTALVNGEKITTEQVEAAYNASYKAAGRDLGHEANNPLSQMVQARSGSLEKEINDAVKEKEYNKAAALTLESVLFRNVLNPFVGGGTNWIFLKLEKNGLGLASGLYYKLRQTPLDMTTEAGMKQLEKALYSDMRVRDSFLRGAIGGTTAALTALMVYGIINTDDYRKWRNRNKWAAKYLDVITPEALLADMAHKNGELGYYLSTLTGMGTTYDNSKKFVGGVSNIANGNKGKGMGQVGEAIGSTLSFPAPWRIVRDVQQVYQGIRGQQPYAVDTQTSPDFVSGFLKAGMMDYIGLRDRWMGDQKPTGGTGGQSTSRSSGRTTDRSSGRSSGRSQPRR